MDVCQSMRKSYEKKDTNTLECGQHLFHFDFLPNRFQDRVHRGRPSVGVSNPIHIAVQALVAEETVDCHGETYHHDSQLTSPAVEEALQS